MRCQKPPARFWVAVMIFFSTYMNYALKVNISVSVIAMVTRREGEKGIPECVRERNETLNTTVDTRYYGPTFDWDTDTEHRIIAAFFWGFVPASIVAGIVSEWVGPHITLTVSFGVSAVLNSLTVSAAFLGWEYVIVLRFLIGALGAFIYPSLHCLISRWAPPEEKGKFVGALMGNTLGTCITWPLVGTVTHYAGWQWGFHVITIEVALFCVFIFFLVADSPQKHKWMSETEREFLMKAQGSSIDLRRTVPPYWSMVKSVPFWAVIIAHFGDLWGIYLQVTGVPLYLFSVLGFNIKDSGGIAAVPPLMRMVFGMMFGVIQDIIVTKDLMSTTKIRKVFTIFSHILPALLLYCMMLVGCNVYPSIAILSLSQGMNGAAAITNVENPLDLAPNYAGTIFAIMTFVGGTSGFITPEVTNALIKDENSIKQWRYNFAIGGSVYMFCGIVFMIFGSGKKQPWNAKQPVDTT